MGKLNGNSKNYLILEDHASWQIAASVSKSANCGYFSSKWLFYGLQMVVTNDLLTWKMIHGWKMTHVLFIEKLVPFQNQHSFIFGEKKTHANDIQRPSQLTQARSAKSLDRQLRMDLMDGCDVFLVSRAWKTTEFTDFDGIKLDAYLFFFIYIYIYTHGKFISTLFGIG